MSSSSSAPAAAQGLRRTLTLWQLVLYGVIVIQPTAPMPNFGVFYERGHGHVVTTILIAMFAMLLTAISYGKMAAAYPSAGSAFTYVGQEIHPSLGFVTGWSMAMDYMLNPLICIIWCSQAAHTLAPGVPYHTVVFPLFFFALFTGLNLRGIKTSAGVNTGLAIGMGVVIALFFICALRYLFGHPPEGAGAYTRPFYDPATFESGAVLGGTSLAVLTYIGFDGISTLSEEAQNPTRNILLATVFSCLAIGLLSAVQVYLAQLVWPPGGKFSAPETAFIDVAQRAAGGWFATVVNVTLLVATIGSGMGAQLGAARLLFGMGRSKALPGFFAAVNPKTQVPANSVIFVGVIALAGAALMKWTLGEGAFDMGANMLNFGALIAFMGVNMACFLRYFARAEKKNVFYLVAPLIGFAICALLWWNLTPKAKILGAVWMVVGVAYGAVKTRGFRSNLVNFDVPA